MHGDFEDVQTESRSLDRALILARWMNLSIMYNIVFKLAYETLIKELFKFLSSLIRLHTVESILHTFETTLSRSDINLRLQMVRSH
jgi:hypothetical protein